MIVTSFLLAYTEGAHSQAVFFVKGSYNSFSMSDLKNLQNELLSDLTGIGVPATATEAYPGYLGFQFGLLVPVQVLEKETIFVGGFGEFTSTGGRIHYKDYSGEVRADQIAKGYSFGGIIELKRNYSDILDVEYQFSLRLVKSKLNNTFFTQIGNATQIEQPSFSSFSFGAEPGITPSMNFGGFRAGLSLSYLFCLPTSLEYDSYANAYLINKNKEKVTIDWSGPRVGIVLSYSLPGN